MILDAPIAGRAPEDNKQQNQIQTLKALNFSAMSCSSFKTWTTFKFNVFKNFFFFLNDYTR